MCAHYLKRLTFGIYLWYNIVRSKQVHNKFLRRIYMNKFFVVLVLLIALAISGCVAYTYPDGSSQKFMMIQTGVILRVVNNCSPLMDIETTDGLVLKGLGYGGSETILLNSVPFSGNYRRMPVVAKGYTARGEYLGSLSREFSVNTRQGTRREIWEINSLRLPGWSGRCRQ